MLGLQLHIYDSFEGVASQQVLPDADHQTRHDSTRFTGTYASPESVLRNNLARHGEPTVSTIHKGWFAETIGKDQAAGPVRAVYIDCDIVKGTEEVLMGSLPSLVRDGVVFSQDFMIISVRKMLTDPATWTGLNSSTPTIKRLSWALARLDF
jgi:hypothetical protein